MLSVARRGSPFTREERALFGYLAQQTSVAMENVALHDRLRWQATVDELTGLANRRRFQDSLATEVQRMVRFGRPLALAILEIDGFKAVNDAYGYPQGDLVLREVAAVLRRSSRPTDEPARYRGEQLALILPNTDPDGAFVDGRGDPPGRAGARGQAARGGARARDSQRRRGRARSVGARPVRADRVRRVGADGRAARGQEPHASRRVGPRGARSAAAQPVDDRRHHLAQERDRDQRPGDVERGAAHVDDQQQRQPDDDHHRADEELEWEDRSPWPALEVRVDAPLGVEDGLGQPDADVRPELHHVARAERDHRSGSLGGEAVAGLVEPAGGERDAADLVDGLGVQPGERRRTQPACRRRTAAAASSASTPSSGRPSPSSRMPSAKRPVEPTGRP